MALKQASKLDYYRKENEQLKEQIRNLQTNLRLNKELLALTESGKGADETLAAYQAREAAMQSQMEQLTKQRDDGQAQILIFEQLLADFKQNENDQVRELEY